ncbi:hypothetical protein SDC9_129625 [bioreactor metagenome]|uniref:Uncharacterized protein n=1 Tax=bioreactor metagenome TaxID=1076179 RepID=A0A645D026_9ZZZZ
MEKLKLLQDAFLEQKKKMNLWVKNLEFAKKDVMKVHLKWLKVNLKKKMALILLL